MESIDEDSDDEDDEISGNFFNDLFSVIIENERATWTKVELTGKKDPTKKIKKKIEEIPENDQKVDDTEEAVQNLQLEGTTKVVEEGAFTISR